MRRHVVFIFAALSALFCAISSTIISVAFKDIMSSFDASIVAAGWVLTIAQLANCITMPLTGKVAEIIGQKRCFILCMAFFAVGSVLCMFAPNLPMLILFRFIQGLGVGASLPITNAIVASEFPEDRARYVGLLTSIFPIGQIFGPNLGGWLTTVYGWRANFWIFILPGSLAMILAIFLLKDKSRKPGGKMDLTGTGILTAAVSSLMVGISLLGNKPQIPWLAVGLSFAGTIVLTFIFVTYQRRTANPIIEVEILQEKRFLLANLFNTLWGAGLLGAASFIPFYAVTVYGMSTMQSGLIITPRSIAITITSFCTAMFILRKSYRRPMLLGMSIFVFSLCLLFAEFRNISLFGTRINNVVLLSGILFIAGLGQGFVNPAANNASIELRPDRVATMTGIMGLFRQIGGTIAVGVYALILNNFNSAQGFQYIFAITISITLLCFPLAFIMPTRPGERVTAKITN